MSKKSTKFLVGGLLIVGVVIALFASVSSQNLTYYHTTTEVLAAPAEFAKKKVRIMGLVEKGSIQWEPKSTKLDFRITEDGKTFLNVSYIGSRPDMFKEGQGVVVEGSMQGSDLFAAQSLLVKHSEEYKVDHDSKKGNYYKSLAN